MSEPERHVSVDRWTAPDVAGGDDAFHSTRGERGLSLRDLERIQKDAYDEAFAQGKADGLAEGRAEAAQRLADQAALLDTVLGQLAEPFASLDTEVEEQTARLAMTIVKRLFRRELKTDPNLVIGVVREALDALPLASRNVRVLLHPDDAELVADALSDTDGERAWHIVEDPLLTRGGCRVETATSRVDARAESRIATIANALLGDERGSASGD
ncbi:MAG: flagellar assembly protein FliH [Pseudomonadota bacterium]